MDEEANSLQSEANSLQSEANSSLSLDLLNLNHTVDEECMICKDELSQHQCYKLPECGHKYHTHCLVSWFRNGDSRCPYCGNNGINNKSYKNEYTYYRGGNTYEVQYLSDLRKFSNLKKNQYNSVANKIKAQFDKIKNLENNLKEHKQCFFEFKKNLKSEQVNYTDTRKKMHSFRNDRWKLVRRINGAKFKLINNSYIIPLIIPTYVNLN